MGTFNDHNMCQLEVKKPMSVSEFATIFAADNVQIKHSSIKLNINLIRKYIRAYMCKIDIRGKNIVLYFNSNMVQSFKLRLIDCKINYFEILRHSV